MIKANDLRIGNLFHPIQTNTPVHLPTTFVFEVKTIDLTGVRSMMLGKNEAKIDHYPEFRYNELSPISINSKELINLGFKHRFDLPVDNNPWILDGFIVEESINKDYFVLISTEGFHSTHLRSIKYVHELQNVYYILTGKELIYDKTRGNTAG